MTTRTRVSFGYNIQGTDAAETFQGGGGSDTINAGGGDDVIYANGGADKIDGGDGNDTIYAGSEDDVITGGNGDDKMYGEDGNDTFKADAGWDAMDGGTGFDTVDYSTARPYGLSNYMSQQVVGVTVNLQTGIGGNTAAGDTYVSIENVIGSAYRDFLTGSDADNVISGLSGDDVIDGGKGNDTLDGGVGSDTIVGGDGKDTIIGGLGTDKMAGGADADTFVFLADQAANASKDVIKDFQVGIDQLYFKGFDHGEIGMETVDGGTMVWAKDGEHVSDFVILLNVDAADLAAHAADSFLI